MLRQRREMDHPAEGGGERKKERERDMQIQGRAHKLANGWSSTTYWITPIHPTSKYSPVLPPTVGNIRNMLK